MAASPSTYQPLRRSNHCSLLVNGVLYTWGGVGDSDLHTMEIYDGEYKHITTTGDFPESVFGSCCAAVGNTIFHWGGVEGGSITPTSNVLYYIVVDKWVWRKIQVTNPRGVPPPKDGSQMIALRNKLVVVGGKTGTDGSVVTNDTHTFSISEGKWSKHTVEGVPLPPISSFSLTKVDDRFCILYGGLIGKGGRNNDIYVLDTETWKCSLVKVTGSRGRYSHGACLLVSEPHPQLLVTGGLGDGDVDPNDSWVVEVHIADSTATCTEVRVYSFSSQTLVQVTLPEDTRNRSYHTTTAIASGASPMVVVDGGLRYGHIIKDTVIVTMAMDHAGGEAGRWRVREVVSVMEDPGRAQDLMSSARVQAAITTQDPQFPGIHFLGTPWTQTVTSEGQKISWDSIGVAFSIPPGAVPKEELLQLTVRPCLTGPFQPPDQYQLTSPSYQISSSAKFTKDIEVVLYHSVNLRTDADCERMTFLLVPSTPTCDRSQPQYKCEVLSGGVFHKKERFGTIKLRQPSDLAIGTTGPNPQDTYSVRLYSNSEAPYGPCTRAIFCMVPSQPLYTKHLKKYMEKSEPGIKTSVEFIEDDVEFADTTVNAYVTLKIPSETPGYKIVSAKNPLKISRKHLDSVLQSTTELPDDYPKKLSLNISPEGGSATPSSSTWDLTVLGLKEELSFSLRFPVPPTTELITHTTTVSASVSVSKDGILNRLLTVSDFREVYHQMYPQMVKWWTIGLHLGLDTYLLENISLQYGKNEQRLEKALLEWLKRRNLNPCWQSLIDALNYHTVGNNGAAVDIREYVLSKAAEGEVQSHKDTIPPPVYVEQKQSQEDIFPPLLHSPVAVRRQSLWQWSALCCCRARRDLSFTK